MHLCSEGTSSLCSCDKIASLQRLTLLSLYVQTGLDSTHLSMWHKALNVLGHTGGVIGCGTAYTLYHVNPISRLATHGAVMLRASEVCTFLCHLSQLQALCTSACHAVHVDTCICCVVRADVVILVGTAAVLAACINCLPLTPTCKSLKTTCSNMQKQDADNNAQTSKHGTASLDLTICLLMLHTKSAAVC